MSLTSIISRRRSGGHRGRIIALDGNLAGSDIALVIPLAHHHHPRARLQLADSAFHRFYDYRVSSKIHCGHILGGAELEHIAIHALHLTHDPTTPKVILRVAKSQRTATRERRLVE